MKDFFKIFISISALAGSFLIGSNYGEKTYRESTEYKNFLKASEELNFARSDIENIKAKLQNITDRAETKKTEELLSQILNVFLVDLGLQIQNKEAILKQAKHTEAPPVCPPAKENKAVIAVPSAPDSKNSKITNTNFNKFKSYEWMVKNSNGDFSTMRDLKKVEIKSLNNFLERTELSDKNECEEFLGVYKGSVKDINNQYYGSFEFELKNTRKNAKKELSGKLAWYSQKNKGIFAEQIENNCGRKIKGLSGRIFNVSEDKYVQLYKLNNLEKTAGNFYEKLPNGTSKVIGSFILNRVDRF